MDGHNFEFKTTHGKWNNDILIYKDTYSLIHGYSIIYAVFLILRKSQLQNNIDIFQQIINTLVCHIRFTRQYE